MSNISPQPLAWAIALSLVIPAWAQTTDASNVGTIEVTDKADSKTQASIERAREVVKTIPGVPPSSTSTMCAKAVNRPGATAWGWRPVCSSKIALGLKKREFRFVVRPSAAPFTALASK